MKITKAIIPVAGLGTRMLPATKSIPKEMLPVFDKPLIQYIVEEAVAAGIEEIVLVTREGKSAIDNHFSQNVELEELLERKGKYNLLSTLRESVSNKASIVSVTQQQANGLGHAVLCARSVVGDAPFAVLLPDVLIDEYLCSPHKENLAAMIKRFNRTRHSQVMVEKVPLDKVHNYGVVDCQGYPLSAGRGHLMSAVVEKPRRECAPSNLCIVGRYVFGTEIWPLLETVKPDASGEIQLTDAIVNLICQHDVEAYCVVGKSHDCGDKYGYARANLEYALRDQSVGEQLEQHMKDNMCFEHNCKYPLAINS